MVGYSDEISRANGMPEADQAQLPPRYALLAHVAGDFAAQAAINAGWELGEGFVQPRAEALADADGAIFMSSEDAERQIGSEVKKSAAQVSRRERLDPHLVHGAALIAMALAGNGR